MSDRQTLSRTRPRRAQEQRGVAGLLVALMPVAALASAVMVAPLFAFPSLLADPGRAERSGAIAERRADTALESDHAFVVAAGTLCIPLVLLGSKGLTVPKTLLRFRRESPLTLARRLHALSLREPGFFALDRHPGDLTANAPCGTQQVADAIVPPPMQTPAHLTSLGALTGSVIAMRPVAGIAIFGQVGAVDVVPLPVTRARLATRMEINVGTRRFEVQGVVSSSIVLICRVPVRPDRVGTPVPALGQRPRGPRRTMPDMASPHGALMQMRFGSATACLIRDHSAATARAGRPPLGRPPQPVRLRPAHVLHHASFADPKAENTGLSDKPIPIRADERIGITGATGPGKTTPADLPVGGLVLQSGRPGVGGVEIRDATARAPQRPMSEVPQDIFLTDANLARIFALCVPPGPIDHVRTERSVRLALLRHVVPTEPPLVYETWTGEPGMRLSGGQRQRAGNARAPFHDADPIVLDEATSAPDAATERDAISANEGLPGETTGVMIAHRLSNPRTRGRFLRPAREGPVADGPRPAPVDGSATIRAFAPRTRGAQLGATG